MLLQLKTEKLINKPASDVFQALKGGLLFMNCGADSSTLKIDFRVGGKYQIDFKNHSLVNFGEFTEIIPNKKISFSWCQTFGPDQKPDTQVTIELFEDGPKTRLVLVHTGFKDQATKENHQKGWTDGINDFDKQMESGTLRMLRSFNVSPERLYEVCKNPETFFAFMGDLSKGSVDFKVGGKYQVPNGFDGISGEFLEIVPNKKIVFSWQKGVSGPLKNSKVNILINKKDDGTSALEIVHEGLTTFTEQQAHRGGWDAVAKNIKEGL
jgi:uncharacterized protein YndB with AHSA1/START domain